MNSPPIEPSTIAIKGTTIGSAPPCCLVRIRRFICIGICGSVSILKWLMWDLNKGLSGAGTWTSPCRAFNAALEFAQITASGAFSITARATFESGAEARYFTVRLAIFV